MAMKPIRKEVTPLILVPETEVRTLAKVANSAPPVMVMDKYLREAQQLTRLTVQKFATDVSDHISDLSDTVLEETTVSEISSFSNGLSKIALLTKEVDFDKFSAANKAEGFLGKVRSFFAESKEKIVARTTSIQKRIDEISVTLEKHRVSMEARLKNLETLFVSNMEEYSNLDAAEQALARVKKEQEDILESMKGKVGLSQDSGISMLKQSDQMDFVLKLGVQLEYIQKMKHLALLTVPEIRRSQNNISNLISKYEMIKNVTLPAWRKQLKLIIESLEQKKEAQAANAIDDQTNEFLKKSSDLAGQNYVEVTKLSQRSVMDTDTLVHMQQQLLDSTQKAQEIIETARADRENTQRVITDMRKQLKETYNPAKSMVPVRSN